ncbi:MAG: YbgC/FadM family acyl-CoA thioesterase [Burkholderiales bacterium]|nr:YbgC/FadM family acyl-CoA thioesterase [Burkholderiales bacterium]
MPPLVPVSLPATRRFAMPVRVYYQDTDAGGMVFHATYLDFLERARMEWLRSVGWEARRVVAEFSVMFVVRNAALDFVRPAVLDDLLDVSLAVVHAGGAHLELDQRVDRAGEPLVRARVELAFVSLPGHRVARMPGPFRAALADWTGPQPEHSPP